MTWMTYADIPEYALTGAALWRAQRARRPDSDFSLSLSASLLRPFGAECESEFHHFLLLLLFSPKIQRIWFQCCSVHQFVPAGVVCLWVRGSAASSLRRKPHCSPAPQADSSQCLTQVHSRRFPNSGLRPVFSDQSRYVGADRLPLTTNP